MYIPGDNCNKPLGGRKVARSGVLSHAQIRMVEHARTIRSRENTLPLSPWKPPCILDAQKI